MRLGPASPILQRRLSWGAFPSQTTITLFLVMGPKRSEAKDDKKFPALLAPPVAKTKSDRPNTPDAKLQPPAANQHRRTASLQAKEKPKELAASPDAALARPNRVCLSCLGTHCFSWIPFVLDTPYDSGRTHEYSVVRELQTGLRC